MLTTIIAEAYSNSMNIAFQVEYFQGQVLQAYNANKPKPYSELKLQLARINPNTFWDNYRLVFDPHRRAEIAALTRLINEVESANKPDGIKL